MEDLLATLAALEAERSELLKEDCLLDCWISTSKPAGTASRSAKPHHQLRSRLPQFSGKKSRYLKAKEVAAVEQAIERGRRLAAVERAIAATVKKLDR